MPIRAEPTPNPNALKFTVGRPVGGPKTYTAGSETDEPFAAEILAVEGVTSVFMTADFVTVTKASDADWSTITGPVEQTLTSAFGD